MCIFYFFNYFELKVTYCTPINRWFPDRRGLATGLALTAFGGGAMLATPINEALFSTFFEMPTYLGAVRMHVNVTMRFYLRQCYYLSIGLL